MENNQTAINRSTVSHGRFELLDGLRFFAALAVMLFHFGFRAWNGDAPGYLEYPFISHIFKYGYLGVDLFFMISGFVILMSASRCSVASFVRSRFIRLYPGYWLCVAITFAFLSYWETGNNSTLTVRDFLINLTMFQSFVNIRHIDGSYWTLVIELHFYALVVLVLWARQVHNIDRILAIWLAAGVAADFIPNLNVVSELYVGSWCHYFVAGALAYRIRIAGINLFRLIIFIAAFLQAARHAHWFMALKERLTNVTYEPWVVQLIVALMFGVFLLLALGRLNFQNRLLEKMGALTYPLYLIHGAIGSTLLVFLVRHYQMNHWVALLIISCLSIACAWLIHRYFESPLALRLRGFLGR